jgi:predicted Kef-type K+ transport protein
MHSFQTEQVFAAIIVISGLSLIFVALVEVVGRIMMPWYYQNIQWQGRNETAKMRLMSEE